MLASVQVALACSSALFAAALMSGCASPPMIAGGAGLHSGSQEEVWTPPDSNHRSADLKAIKQADREAGRALLDFHDVAAVAAEGYEESGYFSSSHHAALESAYIRWREPMNRLDEIRRTYVPWVERGLGRNLSTIDELECQVLGLYADRVGFLARGKFVAALSDEPKLAEKFEEQLLVSKEPRGLYGRQFLLVTSTEDASRRRKEMKAARKIADELLAPTFQGALHDVRSVDADAVEQREQVLQSGYALLPKVSNVLHHTEIAGWVRERRLGVSDRVSNARDIVYTKVARMRVPGDELTSFTSAQIEQLQESLRPGDILLTYTGGYMGNLFLSGAFKHAIVYIGSAQERKSLGFPSKQLVEQSKGKVSIQDFQRRWIDSADGRKEVDVIESVAEGVIFNSLEHLMHTHATRVVALRPRLSIQEREQFLGRVFGLLGTRYDFAFDFSDASRHCCTEVVYRALNHRGKVRFELSKRGGHYNLSADDILRTHLSSKGAFDLVFLVTPNGDGDNSARILRGRNAERKLIQLLEE